MPEISRFLGIIIIMYYNDHAPAHFHAKYGEHHAKVDIVTGELLDGHLPRRALSAVQEWREMNTAALIENWTHAMAHEPLNRIEPLE